MTRQITSQTVVTALRGESVKVFSVGKSNLTKNESVPALLLFFITDADGEEVAIQLTPEAARSILPLVQLVASTSEGAEA